MSFEPGKRPITATLEPNHTTSRLYFMDNLRAIAVLLSVFFHAALAYCPLLQNLWLTADPESYLVLDWLTWLSHKFIMPLCHPSG